MAKLSARGRFEIARFERRTERLGPYTLDYDEQWSVQTIALMSDRNILEKSKWKSARWDKPFDKPWTVRGKLKPDVTNEQWIENRIKHGWTKV